MSVFDEGVFIIVPCLHRAFTQNINEYVKLHAECKTLVA